jgi:hypothetical protein
MITDPDAILFFEIIIRAAPALILLGLMGLATLIWKD